MRILHVDSSILGEHSVSRSISREVVQSIVGRSSAAAVQERDLTATPLPHLTLANLPGAHPLATRGAEGALTAEQIESDRILQEFIEADTIVVGAPMYNFSAPSQLKAWIDRILIPGATFRYGDKGPEGLAGGKRVVIVVARGGFYGQGSPAASFEHLESYLRTVFSFMGVRDLETVVAEGVAGGPDARRTAMERASLAARELRAA